MQSFDFIPYIPWLIGGGLAIGLAGTWGWVHTTKLKIANGYPLEGMWGQSLKPSTDGQTAQRVALLTKENAELRAELGSMKDRLGNVERIVTDSGYQLTHEINTLRDLGRDSERDRAFDQAGAN
ncbi:MAG: hypothetical protein WA908_02325 [Pontixanthobacter sp.]